MGMRRTASNGDQIYCGQVVGVDVTSGGHVFFSLSNFLFSDHLMIIPNAFSFFLPLDEGSSHCHNPKTSTSIQLGGQL